LYLTDNVHKSGEEGGETMRATLASYASIPKAKIDFQVGQIHQHGIVQRERRWLLATLIINDLFTIALSFILAFFIRFVWGADFFRDSIPSLSFYLELGAFLIPGWIILFALFGLYNRQNLLGGLREYSLLFNATTLAMLLLIVFNFLTEIVLARGWLLLTWVLVFVLTALGRFIIRRIVYYMRAKGQYLSPAIIVGLNEESKMLAVQFLERHASGLALLGFVADGIPVGAETHNGLRVLGGLDDLEQVVRENEVEEVIVTSSAVAPQDVLTIFKMFGLTTGVNLRLSSGLYEIITTGLRVQDVAGVPLVTINKVRLTGYDQVFKSIIDYTLAVSLIIPVGLVSLVLAILVRLDSPGPIIHRRRVVGQNGKSFDAFKFRTMYVNGDEILAGHPELKAELEREHKLKDDPRITRLGKVLRKISFDELPQLLNVLRGEMSIVGPRMISPEEMEKYQQSGMNLLTVKPGITGLWQVSGRSDVSYEERVRMDMYYIRNWSIWLDVMLLWRSIPAILLRRGAY
jgi:exopolysaccharide biosynthesis polyprenyl glycosylphosphotransferase